MKKANELNVESNFGKSFEGWWFGVWQNDKLVEFGAGYKRKEKCFKHEREAIKIAKAIKMKPVLCTNPSVISRKAIEKDRLDHPSTI